MAHTFSLLTGETVTPIIPNVESGNPLLRDISFQVFPLSSLFHNAEPSPPELKLYGVLLTFQVEAYIILEFVGSIIKSTTPESSLAYKILFQFFPPSTLL